MGPAPQWTDDELLDIVRAAAAECGQPLRHQAYQAWAKGHADRPNAGTVVSHLGHWTEVQSRAGLQVDRGYKLWRQ